MRLYSEITLNEQLDRLYLSPKQKDKVRYMIENIMYRYSKQIEKMKCCGNCKHNIKPATKESILFCCECKKLDETKDNIILTKWELTV